MASALIFPSEVGMAYLNSREEGMASVLVSPSVAGVALFPSVPGQRAWHLLLFLVKKTLPVSPSRRSAVCLSVSFNEEM